MAKQDSTALLPEQVSGGQHELAHWTSKGITVMGKQGQSFLWAASVGISMALGGRWGRCAAPSQDCGLCPDRLTLCWLCEPLRA